MIPAPSSRSGAHDDHCSISAISRVANSKTNWSARASSRSGKYGAYVFFAYGSFRNEPKQTCSERWTPLHALDARVEETSDVGGGVRIVRGVARRRRLVELDPLAPGGREPADLVVERRHERLGEVRAIAVVLDRADERRQRERPRQRHLDVAIGTRPHVLELLDRAHAVRHADRSRRLLHRPHVERHRAHLAQRSCVTEAGHARREGPHEAGSPHLAVADDVEPGLLLIRDRAVDGVVEGLGDVGRTEAIRLHQLLRRVEPRRLRVAPDDRGRQHRKIGRQIVSHRAEGYGPHHDACRGARRRQ